MTMPYTFNTKNLSPDEYHALVLNRSDWFLFHCRAGGYTFQITKDGLKITPLHAIDEEMHRLLKQHKASLLTILESEAVFPQSYANDP